jgi:hypothetical protein
MLIRQAIAAALLLTHGPAALGQPLPLEPEECILQTLRGSTAAKEAAPMVRSMCVRRYIKSVEASSVPVTEAQVTISWTPSVWSPSSSNVSEIATVKLKNDSQLTVIAADFALTRNTDKNRQNYKAYADFPIAPGTVGNLSAPVMTGSPVITVVGSDHYFEAQRNFYREYSAAVTRVYGVPK